MPRPKKTELPDDISHLTDEQLDALIAKYDEELDDEDIDNKPKNKNKYSGTRAIDETGNRYGMLEVIRKTDSKNKDASWLCRCDCGQYKVVIGYNLRSGHTKSCGCIQQKIKPGRRFGYLTIKKQISSKPTKWECKCKCGKTVIKTSHSILVPTPNCEKSCGCALEGIKTKDIPKGTRFGLLEVIKQAERNGHGSSMWECVCLGCKKKRTVRGNSLRTGETRSCGGCLRTKKGKALMSRLDRETSNHQ